MIAIGVGQTKNDKVWQERRGFDYYTFVSLSIASTRRFLIIPLTSHLSWWRYIVCDPFGSSPLTESWRDDLMNRSCWSYSLTEVIEGYNPTNPSTICVRLCILKVTFSWNQKLWFSKSTVDKQIIKVFCVGKLIYCICFTSYHYNPM